MSSVIADLPCELLCWIFSLATCSCSGPATEFYDRGVSSLTTPGSLSTVCKRWRHIILGSPTLWSHIHISVDTRELEPGYPSPQLWVKHSHGLPLELYIFQYIVEDADDEDADLNWVIGRPASPWTPMAPILCSFITPLLPQVSWLTLTINWPYENLLNMLVCCGQSHGIVGCAKSLRIYNEREGESPELQSEVSSRFFDSLIELCLRNANLSEPKNVIYGLTRLEIDQVEEEWNMTLGELTAVLIACPKLEYLLLNWIDLNELSRSFPSPALLSELKVLRVGHTKSGRMIEAILAIIEPGSNPLHMRMSLAHVRRGLDSALSGLHSFLGRSNVSTLYIYARYAGDSIRPVLASQIGPLPGVQTLVLDRLYFYDEFYVDMSPDNSKPADCTTSLPVTRCPPLWPQLKDLYLEHCYLDKDSICGLLSAHLVQTLYMRNCHDDVQEEYFGDIDVGTELGEQYVQVLSQVVPSVAHHRNGRSLWP